MNPDNRVSAPARPRSPMSWAAATLYIIRTLTTFVLFMMLLLAIFDADGIVKVYQAINHPPVSAACEPAESSGP